MEAEVSTGPFTKRWIYLPCGRFDSGKFERTDKDQPRSSCIWGIGAIAAETCEKYCDGVVGDGTFNQLQHYLYDE